MIFTKLSKVFEMISDLKYRVYGIHGIHYFSRRTLRRTQRATQTSESLKLKENKGNSCLRQTDHIR